MNHIEELYLDYVNNFLTVSRFAEYYSISTELAEAVINEGRSINEQNSVSRSMAATYVNNKGEVVRG